MMAERSIAPSAAAIAEHYAGLIDGFVLDEADRAEADGIAAPASPVEVTAAVMTARMEKQALARAVLAFAEPFA